MTKVTAAELLGEALGLNASEITQDVGLETSDSWDSLAHFRVVSAIEEAIGRPLSPPEIFETIDYLSVEALLSKAS